MRIPADNRDRHLRAWLIHTPVVGVGVVTLLGAIVVPALPAEAATQTVTNCNDSGAGSLRQAVANANPGDTVSFEASLACPTITLTSGRITISTNLTVTGPGADVLAVSGDDADAVFEIASGDTVSISGLTIEDAKNADAIVNDGTVTLTADTVSGNDQGAMVNDGTASVFDSTVSDNSTTGAGGGIVNNDKLAVNNSTVAGNRAGFGGGIYNGGGGNLSVVDTTLSGNTASGNGGGIYNDSHAANVLFFGTIVAASGSGKDCAGGDTDGGDNLDDDGTCGFVAGSDVSDTPAGLDPAGLGDNGGPTETIALEPGSAAIGADDNAQLCAGSDQRGVARPTPCDIGAYQTATMAVSNCNDSGAGSLRQAVADAASDAAVVFALNPPCSTIDLSSPIDITTNMAIDGPGASVLAVSGGGDVQDLFVASGVTASISGLTIEKGSTNGEGGGVLNDGTLTVTASAVSGNAATTGGGVANAGTLTIADSSLSDNSASDGGGGAVATLSAATTVVTGSLLTGNSADDEGGALFNMGAVNGSAVATSVVESTTVADNTSTFYGGGISSGGDLTILRSTLSGNSSSGRGGGIESYGGTLLLSTSTVAGNTSANGGGLENDGTSEATVVTSTFSGNTGGDLTQLAGTLNLEATIVADSISATDCTGTIADHGQNLADDGSCGLVLSNDIPDSPAGLDPRGLENNGGPTETIALEPGSPAIGGVDSAVVCAAPDQRGVARPTPCDIGAVDAVLSAQTITFTSTAPTAATVGGPTYAVAAVASSGLPVTLTVDPSATAVCTVAATTVTFIGTGTCVIDANQGGGGNYAPAAEVKQSFSVGPALDAITSADHFTAVVDTLFSFTVTTSAVSSISVKGALPRHLHFVDHGDGTATLSGRPPKAGTYPLTIKARFGRGKTKVVVTQAFTLTVDPT